MLIHGAPWFSAPKPKFNDELEVWQVRVAMIDAIFYDD
jgi:hypothetical protein